jgi:hypothetical protein
MLIEMNAKTRFIEMYEMLPDNAQTEMVVDFATNPKTLRVCYNEIIHNTNLGKRILLKLGYKDD